MQAPLRAVVSRHSTGCGNSEDHSIADSTVLRSSVGTNLIAEIEKPSGCPHTVSHRDMGPVGAPALPVGGERRGATDTSEIVFRRIVHGVGDRCVGQLEGPRECRFGEPHSRAFRYSSRLVTSDELS